MEFKAVRLVEGEETKSQAELEAQVLKEHEQQQAAADDTAAAAAASVDGGGGDDGSSNLPELKEEDVLSYIGKRYNKQINSFDELMAERSQAEDMPEDVAAYMKYKKETG